jgi:hypothetical protein
MRYRCIVLFWLAVALTTSGGSTSGHSAAENPAAAIAVTVDSLTLDDGAVSARVDSLALDGGSVSAWVDSLAFDGGSIAGIELFAKERGGDVGMGYARELSAGVRRLISADVERQIRRLATGNRSTFIEVSLLEAGFASAADAPPGQPMQREFEKSFIRTEVLAFFADEDTPPRAALGLYTEPEFRKAVSPRIERIWNEGEEVCIEIDGVRLVLDPMAYCDRVDNLHEEDLSVQHTQTVRNTDGDGHQTVFFKESLKTFVRLPDGLAFHYVNYSRTIGMGGFKKRFGLGHIKESEEKAVQELGRRLAADTTEAAE